MATSRDPAKRPWRSKGSEEGGSINKDHFAMVERVLHGESQSQVARDFGVSRQLVHSLVKKCKENGGIEFLDKSTRERARHLNNSELIWMKDTVESKKPSDWGIEGEEWNVDALIQLIHKKFGYKVTRYYITRIHKNWGIKEKKEREDEFDPDFYEYIESDIGKKIAQREREFREKSERELKEKFKKDVDKAESLAGKEKRKRGRPKKVEQKEQETKKSGPKIVFESKDLVSGLLSGSMPVLPHERVEGFSPKGRP